jgi:hypothetical protein
MADAENAARLRQQLAGCRQTKGFNQYPAEVRDEAVRYACARRSQGATPTAIASELGVAVTTADGWSKQQLAPAAVTAPRPRRSRRRGDLGLPLMPVVVRPEPSRGVLARLEVEFGDGARLLATGVGVEELLRAVEALRRRA